MTPPEISNKEKEAINETAPHEGLKNITSTYCIILPDRNNANTKKSSKNINRDREGYCIEGMNMGQSNEGNFQLITLLLGLNEIIDSEKIKKIYNKLHKVYAKKIGVTTETEYDTYKAKIYRSLDKVYETLELRAILEIPLESRIQLIGCILDIKDVNILKSNFFLREQLQLSDSDKKQLQTMDSLWYNKKPPKDLKLKGGTIRRISSKNIYPIYMKRSRNNKRRSKHRGGSWFSSWFGTPTPQAAPSGQPSTQQQLPQITPSVTPPGATEEKKATGVIGGSRRRRKLKQRKTSKHR
jgi:hypothetical protein